MREHPDITSAIMADDPEAVEAMLRADPALASRQDGQSPVLLAAYRRRKDILDVLLRHDPDLDIFEAAAAGVLARVRALTDESPDLAREYAADGFTPLHLASFFGHEDVARLLIERGAPVDAITRNDLENMPLHAASAGRHIAICALLLDNGAPVDAQQSGGFTALHAAGQHGDMELARLLREHNADLSVETHEGKTAADLAYEFEHDEVADYLRP